MILGQVQRTAAGKTDLYRSPSLRAPNTEDKERLKRLLDPIDGDEIHVFLALTGAHVSLGLTKANQLSKTCF